MYLSLYLSSNQLVTVTISSYATIDYDNLVRVTNLVFYAIHLSMLTITISYNEHDSMISIDVKLLITLDN